MDENYFDDWEDVNPLEEIAQEQEVKEQTLKEEEREQRSQEINNALQPLIEAVNATNALIKTSDENAKKLQEGVELLRQALVREDGQNIADFIANSLETHKEALANAGIAEFVLGVEKLSEVQSKILEINENFNGYLESTLETSNAKLAERLRIQNENLQGVETLTNSLINALKKPKEAVLRSYDREALESVGKEVNKAIARQKWWWVSWGVGILLGVTMAIWGVSSKVTAGKQLEKAEKIYQNHQYTWSFWYYMEEWGEKKPKTYEGIIKQFREKYPDIVKQYNKENQDVVEAREGK